MPNCCVAMHGHVGNLTPGRLNDSFGIFGFFAIKVFGLFGISLIPALAVVFLLTFVTGDSNDSISNNVANSSFVNLCPSGKTSLFKMCSLSFSVR